MIEITGVKDFNTDHIFDCASGGTERQTAAIQALRETDRQTSPIETAELL